jgi:hypothetical protein
MCIIEASIGRHSPQHAYVPCPSNFALNPVALYPIEFINGLQGNSAKHQQEFAISVLWDPSYQLVLNKSRITLASEEARTMLLLRALRERVISLHGRETTYSGL